jgi:hypothetical protein
MSICSYKLWKKARENLPESYFDEEEYEHDKFDINITRYQKYTRSAQDLLPKAHLAYLRDVEIINMYIDVSLLFLMHYMILIRCVSF